jgi:agmatine deiminase
MRLDFVSTLAAAALATTACTADTGPEVSPSPLSGLASTKSDSPLPAGMTAEEAVGKADGSDPRDSYPDAYGFTTAPPSTVRFAPEFEQAERLLIGWGSGAFDLERFFASIIAAAAPRIPVTILVPNQQTANYVQADLQAYNVDTANIEFVTAQLDSIWMRDYGPIGVASASGEYFVDARYYFGRWNDDYVPTAIAGRFGRSITRPALAIEGGNLQTDGEGRCVTSEAVLDANADYNATDVQTILRDYYGCSSTAIVPRMVGESTGHVDMWLHITGPGEVLVGEYLGGDAYNDSRLDTTVTRLEAIGFNVTRIPMPAHDDYRVFRSYTNGLAVNGAVLVPVYAEANEYEQTALAALRTAYPGKTIVPIPSDDVIYWSGAIHCVTMTF